MSLLLFRRNPTDQQELKSDPEFPDELQKIIEFPSYFSQARQLEAAARSLQVVMIMVDELTKEIRLFSERPGPSPLGAAFAVIELEAKNLAGEIAQANQRIGEEIAHVQSMVANLMMSSNGEEDDPAVAIVSENIVKIVAAVETVFGAVQSARNAAQYLLKK